MPADQMGYPKVCKIFDGILKIGVDTSIDESLSIWNRSSIKSTSGAIEVDDNVTIMRNVRMVITDLEECETAGIKISDNVIINYGAFLSGEGGLYIGRNVLVGPYAMFLSGDHEIDLASEIYFSPLKNRPIYLEDDCWIGAGAKILGGVRVGNGSVIGAGALISKSVPSAAIVIGVPGKILRFRKKSTLSFIRKMYLKFCYNYL